MSRSRLVAANLALALLFAGAPIIAEQRPPKSPKATGPAAEKIRDGVYRIGTIEVDTIKKEARVAAVINSDVTTLEWVANTKGGAKAYESALTVDTNATTFNAALLLMGLDPSRGRLPTRHFDPIAPQGDAVEIWLEWGTGASARRIRVEEILWDRRTETTLPAGPWVYTGSGLSDGHYMADLDGVLIGFVHSQSPVIENPRPGAVDAFGFVVLNTVRVGLPLNAKLTMMVRAVPPTPKGQR